jgi:hypothetical protein
VLLLITSSTDGTGNILVDKLKKQIFRLNYDLFNDYKLELRPNSWVITNPTGHSISSENITSCFWWKAFTVPIENQDNYVVEEVKYIFRELYNWCRLKNLNKGNPFDYHNKFGKNTLLKIAEKYFNVPETLISLNCEGIKNLSKKQMVAKSLSSALTNTKASLLTTEVDVNKLDAKFPWYLQEKLISDFDVTVFICGYELFAYERSRKDLKGLDWRGEQTFDTNVKEWIKLGLTSEQQQSVFNFCDEINVNWGRLDFMKVDKTLIFLEFNANGQWLFLDPGNEDGLLDSVVNYLKIQK